MRTMLKGALLTVTVAAVSVGALSTFSVSPAEARPGHGHYRPGHPFPGLWINLPGYPGYGYGDDDYGPRYPYWNGYRWVYGPSDDPAYRPYPYRPYPYWR